MNTTKLKQTIIALTVAGSMSAAYAGGYAPISGGGVGSIDGGGGPGLAPLNAAGGLASGLVDGTAGFLRDANGSVTVGYDTEYYWRGADLGYDLVSADFNFDIPVSDSFTPNFGIWYGSWRPTKDSAADELDLYSSFGYSLGPLDLTLGWTYYYFFEGGSDYHEFNVGTSFSLGPIDLGVTWYIAPGSEEYNYVELSTGGTWSPVAGLSFQVDAILGYGDDNFNVFQGADARADDGFTHAALKLSLPIQITDSASLTPYVLGAIALDELEDAGVGDEIIGGVSLSVSF